MANISFMIQSFPGGGVERVIMNLAKPLTEAGHRVFLFVNQLLEDKLPQEDLAITYIKLPYRVRKSKNYPVIVEAVKKYDIKVFFSLLYFPGYLKELRATGLCRIVHVLHGEPFYEKKMKVANITRPRELTLGKWLGKYLVNIPKLKLGYYDRRMLKYYKKAYYNSDAFGVLFDGYGEQIAKALGIDYKESHLCTLQNPIAEFDGDCASLPREKRVVYVGRLTYWDKRLDRLLAVWERIYQRFPEWHLCFVGEGEESVNLRKIVADKGVQRVEFLGWHNNPTQFYRTSEIVCMTSASEGCPMALLEAQQCGCAAVAFDCCSGIHEILSPTGENGVLVPNDDIGAYAEALAELMSDDNLRHKIQANGPSSTQRFSIENSIKQYDALIRKLCAE